MESTTYVEDQPIDHIRLVCASAHCTATKLDIDGKKHLVYKTTCLEPYKFKSPINPWFMNPEFAECSVMDSRGKCTKCGCNWSKHMVVKHLTVEKPRESIEKPDNENPDEAQQTEESPTNSEAQTPIVSRKIGRSGPSVPMKPTSSKNVEIPVKNLGQSSTLQHGNKTSTAQHGSQSSTLQPAAKTSPTQLTSKIYDRPIEQNSTVRWASQNPTVLLTEQNPTVDFADEPAPIQQSFEQTSPIQSTSKFEEHPTKQTPTIQQPTGKISPTQSTSKSADQSTSQNPPTQPTTQTPPTQSTSKPSDQSIRQNAQPSPKPDTSSTFRLALNSKLGSLGRKQVKFGEPENLQTLTSPSRPYLPTARPQQSLAISIPDTQRHPSDDFDEISEVLNSKAEDFAPSKKLLRFSDIVLLEEEKEPEILLPAEHTIKDSETATDYAYMEGRATFRGRALKSPRQWKRADREAREAGGKTLAPQAQSEKSTISGAQSTKQTVKPAPTRMFLKPTDSRDKYENLVSEEEIKILLQKTRKLVKHLEQSDTKMELNFEYDEIVSLIDSQMDTRSEKCRRWLVASPFEEPPKRPEKFLQRLFRIFIGAGDSLKNRVQQFATRLNT